LIFGKEDSKRFNSPVLKDIVTETDWLLQQPHWQSGHGSPQLLQNFGAGCTTLKGLKMVKGLVKGVAATVAAALGVLSAFAVDNRIARCCRLPVINVASSFEVLLCR
jgi:hypothetical protein